MTRQDPGYDDDQSYDVDRAVKGPRGTKVFGRDWLYQLNPNQYRNYLCRAFTYCEIKERFRAEPDENLRKAILQELEEVINGVAQPEVPSMEKLTLYFETHRFPIIKQKKGGTKKLQRYVIIDARAHILQYYSKQEGGQVKKKTYSIDDITFKRQRDGNGRPILNIQPKERPHGPITIVDPSVNITEVYNNIMALKRTPERQQSLEQFLRIYNYSITKRILERFIDVHLYIRDNFLYRKRTVEDLRTIAYAGQQDAVEMLRDCLSKAQQEWMQQDDIFPPHFLGANPLKEAVIKKSLLQLYEDGLMRDLTYGRQEKMTLYNLEYRRMKFKRAQWSKDVREVNESLVGAVNDAHKRLSQGKVSLKQVMGKREIESPLNFDMDTIPFEEVSMIYMNPDPRANSITVCGRIRRMQNIRLQESTDPADHGFYLPRRSAMDQMDIIRIGVHKINIREGGGKYEYALFVTIGERRALIKEFTKPTGDVFIVDKTCNLGFMDSRKESIVLILLRRPANSDEFEACFREKLPYSVNVPKQKNEVFKVQNGAFKIYYNYELLPGCPGNSPTLDCFGSRLTPGSIVGFRVDESHYELGMVIGMKPNGKQVVLEPGVVNKPEKRSVGRWRETYQQIYVDYEDILFQSYEHKFEGPTYWLDYYPDLVSPTMRSEDLQGIIQHEWQLTFEFTFPVEQMVALIHLQQKLKDYNGKAYDIYRRNMDRFIPIGPDIVQDVPLMGTLQVEVFSCSNVQDYRSSDKYVVAARAKRHNEVYESPDIDDTEFQQARKNMHQWHREARKPEATNNATHARLQNSPNDILRWESSYERLLDLGLFYADPTERKVIVLELVRQRGANQHVVRECEVQVEHLMDLNAPISTRYLHMHQPEEAAGTKGLTTECLLVNFIFYPTSRIIEMKGLPGEFYKSTAGLLRLMRERRRLTPEIKDSFDNVVSLGAYDPNMINKFFKSFFYETRDDQLLDAANGIYDVFIPEKSEATLLEGIENDKSLRPPIEESTFKMRQARLWEISQQQSYFYTSYVSDEYVDFHKREAARQHKEPHFSGFESQRFIEVEVGADPNLTIDMNLEQDQQNTEQFRTMFSIVKRGIPKKFRFKIWFQMLNCDKILTALKGKIKSDDAYEFFMRQADNSSSYLLELIDQDLARCELLPIAPTTRLPNVGASVQEMKQYAQEAAASKRARDAHIKGAVRLVLRAYAMWINFENPNQNKPFVYHRGIIWIVYRLVHGGIVDSLSNAFKILLGLAHEMELIFRRNEKTILLNKLDTEGRAFSNLYFQDFMLRVIASLEIFYPELARKIKNFGLPIEYYIGQKFLSMFADNTLPAEHIYLIWDLIIFYSGLEQESYIYGNILPLGATLFFFKNVIDKKLDRKITSAQELKYLVDNPFILDLENMSVPNFSDKVLDIYESLFPSNILGRILSKPADIERRYEKLHAAYKRQFMKNFFHNDVFLSKLRNPGQPLAERDFAPVEQELKRLTQKAARGPEIALNIVDYHLVRANIEEVFGMQLPSKCKFVIGVRYGDQAEKFMTIMNEGLDKQSVDVVRFRLKDWQDKLELRLFVTKFAGQLSNIKDDISEPEEALLSPTRKGQNRIMKHNTEREIQNFAEGKFLTFNKTVKDHSSSDVLIASCEIRLENMQPNVFYKSWYSLKWHSGENEQRPIIHKLHKPLLAHPAEPEVLLTISSLNPVLEAKDKTTFKLQRGIQCRLPQVAKFEDPQFQNEEDLIESLLASYKQKLSQDFGESTQVAQLGGWIINSNFNIVMPPYRPMNLKTLVPRKKSSKTTKDVEEFKAIEGGVPLSIQDIDPFQPEFTPDDDFRFLDNYIGPENLPTLLMQLGHQGPNFEENRRYLGKVREFIQRTWEREEIPPSRIIPLSIRNMMAIIILRSQFSFQEIGEKLYRLVSLPFIREPEQVQDEVFYRVNPFEAASIAQIICERLMVPISGYQVANWVQSSLFGSSAHIIQASIVSEKTKYIDGVKEDVTDLLQRYCHFCHERIGRKVLFLPGLNALAEFKSAVKKISPPRVLMITFSTNSGSVTTEMLFIDHKGNIADAPGEADLNPDERIFRQNAFFSLQGVHDIEGTVSLDSLLSLPVISDWLRMEVSLKQHKARIALSGLSITVDVVGAGTFKFLAGNRRENDFTLQFNGKFRDDARDRMGELLKTETLSDVRYRIIRYLYQMNNQNLMKAIESYVFKTRDGVREINEFISMRQLFTQARGVIHLTLGPSNQETLSSRIGDPPLLVGKRSFGRIAQGDLVKERLHMMNEQIEPNAYALYINGDGSSTFLECEAEACEPGKVIRPQDLPNELYRVRFAGSNIWYLRSRKEIILTHSHWLNEQKFRR